ncbi:phosphodiesterase [Vairimorpha necatrix]|uniref:Phosphodiesterase n=1 Tax=Vairimorpha necatrix TaxID=6039 RepID=A0AAX4J9P9_9MICR
MTRMKTREEKEQLKVLFLCYNSILDNHEIIQLSYDILSKECDFDQNDLHNFLEAAISSYNDIPYHNATHGFNALYNSNILFIDQKLNEKLGFDSRGHNKFDLENLHVDFIKKLLSEFLPGHLTEENMNLISRNINGVKKLNIIDFKMLIKIADIGASYKKFDDFMCGSRKLEKEIRGTCIGGARKKAEQDAIHLKLFLTTSRGVF